MEYKIETYNDILNAVNEENLDRFLIDFKAVLAASLAVKKLSPEIEFTGSYTWIDDNEHKLTFNIITKE